MKTRLPLLSLLLLTAALSGCMVYSHSRPTLTGIEETKFRTFLMIGKANKVKTTVKDATYTRSVSVGALEGQGDAGMVTASGETLGEVIGTAVKKSITP